MIFCFSKKHRKKHVEVASIFVRRNYIEKQHQNDVDYLPIQTTSKKHVDMTWKLADIAVST